MSGQLKQYKILLREGDEEGQPYPLAERSARVVMELRKLQVRSTYYSPMERYQMVKEMLWEDEYLTREELIKDENGEETGQVNFELVSPALSRFDFMNEAAALLFPLAPVVANQEHIDYEVLVEALEDFTSRIDRRRRKLTELFA